MTIEQLYSLYLEHPVVTTDTRDLPEGSVFFALKGNTFNGNNFALQALEKGCAYAVVDEPSLDGKDERLILVDDVLTTMQELARHHRRALGLPILEITGTNGKTTTKELCAAVLSKKYNLLYTLGNLNNHIGVPKTLLRLNKEHEMAVIETGANHPGEIKALAEIVEPDCGLITNVGKAHLEGFGSFEGVMRTKGELYDNLRASGGFLFLHGDNPYLGKMAEGMTAVTYGTPVRGYDVEGEAVEGSAFLKLRWRVKNGEWHEAQTHLIGAYNADNALAAVAVGHHFGVAQEDINAALSEYVPTNNRSELRITERNELIVDAYNANPTSMAAALQNFKGIHHDHKMLILGEMRELGAVSEQEHANIIRMIDEMDCKTVWLVGENFRKVAGDKYVCFKDVEEVKDRLKSESISSRLILIKGSNGTRLFELPELL